MKSDDVEGHFSKPNNKNTIEEAVAEDRPSAASSLAGILGGLL